jgi:hypothetical protein
MILNKILHVDYIQDIDSGSPAIQPNKETTKPRRKWVKEIKKEKTRKTTRMDKHINTEGKRETNRHFFHVCSL